MVQQLLPYAQSPGVLKSVHLEADSKRKAYYNLTIEALPFGFSIKKASGAGGAKPNIETWFRPTLAAALEKYHGLLTAKLNQSRKSPRKYLEILELEL